MRTLLINADILTENDHKSKHRAAVQVVAPTARDGLGIDIPTMCNAVSDDIRLTCP